MHPALEVRITLKISQVVTAVTTLKVSLEAVHMNYAAFHSLHPKLSRSTYQPWFIRVTLLTIKHMEMKTMKYMKLHNTVKGSAFLRSMISLRGLFVLRRLYLPQWLLNSEVKLKFHNLDPFYNPSFQIFQMLFGANIACYMGSAWVTRQ